MRNAFIALVVQFACRHCACGSIPGIDGGVKVICIKKRIYDVAYIPPR